MVTNKETKFLTIYKDKNSKLIHSLENIKKYASLLKEHSVDIRDEALKGSISIFGDQLISVGDLNDIMETLEFNDSKLNEVLGDLIKVVEEENKLIHEHLGKLKIDTAQINANIDKILISYNQEKQRKREIFSNLLGIVMKVAHEIIGVVEEEDTKLVKDYLNQFEGLKKVLDNKSGDDLIYAHFKSILNFLEKVEAGNKIGTIIASEQVKDDAKTFIENFKYHNTGKIIISGFKDLELGDKTFQQIGDKQDKVGKFMRTHLANLFSGIKYTENGKHYYKKERFEELIKVKEDIYELKKKYETKLNNLIAEKLQYETFNDGYIGYKDLLFKLDNEWITFRVFEDGNIGQEAKIKNKRLLDEAIKEIGRLIDSKKDKNPYLQFKTKNIQEGILKGKVDVSVDGDEYFKEGEEFRTGNINDFITEVKTKIEGEKGLKGIERIINENDSFNNGTLIEAAKNSIFEYKFYIIKLLKTIGKNLDKYAQNNFDIDVHVLKEEIKNIINKFNDLSSKKKIELLISDIRYFLEKI